MSVTKATCGVCGEPMPAGEEVFEYHGFSGPCPKPPLPKTKRGWETEFDQSPKLGKAFDDLALILQSRTTEDKARAATDEHKENIKAFIASEIAVAQVELLKEISKAWVDENEFVFAGTLKRIEHRITNKQSEA